MSGGGSWGAPSSIPAPRGDANRNRLIARTAALLSELQGCVVALAAFGVEVPAPTAVDVEGALSTKAAAHRLGISPYTLNELARRGVIPSRQDAPRGPRHFRPTDLDAYEAERTSGQVAECASHRYSPTDVNIGRGQATPPDARHNATAAGGGARRDGDDGGALGARQPTRRLARDVRPYAPGATAWRRPKAPESSS